eukprot:2461031-Rhodomonas_salina.1
MKGARKYRKSKRQKGKEAERKAVERQSDAASELAAATADSPSPVPLADAGAPLRSVRFAPDTKSISRLADDDFLQAFGAQKSRWRWGQ